MKPGRYYCDSHRIPRVEFDDEHAVVGTFLEQDVQACLPSSDELLGICDAVRTGSRERFEGTGNAHTVTIDQSGVTIVNEFSDYFPPVRIALSDFISALRSWRALLLDESGTSAK